MSVGNRLALHRSGSRWELWRRVARDLIVVVRHVALYLISRLRVHPGPTTSARRVLDHPALRRSQALAFGHSSGGDSPRENVGNDEHSEGAVRGHHGDSDEVRAAQAHDKQRVGLAANASLDRELHKGR
jgi:hypothetical protein